ncbi:MAG: hypothetical protein ACLP22_14730 [Solirubrobacteraceae bacterium]
MLQVDQPGRAQVSIERVPDNAEAAARELAAAGLPGEYAQKLVAAAWIRR